MRVEHDLKYRLPNYEAIVRIGREALARGIGERAQTLGLKAPVAPVA